jgi:hypothetical protein
MYLYLKNSCISVIRQNSTMSHNKLRRLDRTQYFIYILTKRKKHDISITIKPLDKRERNISFFAFRYNVKS